MWWCLCLGSLNLVVNAIFQSLWTDPSFTISYIAEITISLLWYIGASALGFFYAAVLVLLAQREKWKHRLAPLAAIGRMALSNYLLHTLILLTLFSQLQALWEDRTCSGLGRGRSGVRLPSCAERVVDA